MVLKYITQLSLRHCTEWVESIRYFLRFAMTLIDDKPQTLLDPTIPIATIPIRKISTPVHCDNTAHSRDRYIQLCRQHLQTLTAEKRPHIERVSHYLGTNTMITSVIRNGIVHTNSYTRDECESARTRQDNA
jgi:hypothetical protein